MYKKKEAGTWKKGKETKGEGNTGRDEGDKGHKEEESGETEKGGGAHPDKGQGTRGYPYPLVIPGREEDLDNSTLAQQDQQGQRLGSDDAQHNRHTTDHTKAKTGDSKGGTTNCQETGGKKRTEGIVGVYK